MRRKIKIILIILGIIFLIFIIASLFKGDKEQDKINNSINNDPVSENIPNLLPTDAKILFVSNRDTNSRRMEIYSMDSDGNNQNRITMTNMHHIILGIDRSHRYIVSSRSEVDTNQPSGLGDEDKRTLWLIDLQTKEERRLTNLENNAEGDSFSPDGEWIVFMMKVKGEEQPDIYKIKKDGSKLTKLTDTKEIIEGDPEFSPSGKEIVFTALGEEGRFIIKMMDTDGKNIRTIYDGGKNLGMGPFPPGNYDPSWSLDGEWITFERAIEDNKNNWGSGVWHIFKVKLDGTSLIDLSLVGSHSNRAEFLPSFSPDSKSIVFGSFFEAENPSESHNDIFKMDSETGVEKRLTTNPASDMYPLWIK